MEDFLVQHFPQYAPFILIALIVFVQYKIFVTPADLEKTYREIVEKLENRVEKLENRFEEKFVTWTVFNTTVAALKEQINKIDQNVVYIRDYIIGGDK